MTSNTKQNLFNVGALVTIVLALLGGRIIDKVHPSFAQMKVATEDEASLILPKILPPGWAVFDGAKCVTWCREVIGSEFDAEVIDEQYRFVHIRMMCDGPSPMSMSTPCTWSKVDR